MLKKGFIVTIAVVLLSISTKIYADNINLQSNEQNEIKFEQMQANDNVISDYKKVSALDLVAHPSKYMEKKIKITGKFDKFTAIGLDYPPVDRDAKNHISFMIRRSNVTGYVIPLSELKLIVKRDYAEKELINIETGDNIEIYGTVFSKALGDPWVDVDKVVILNAKDKQIKTNNNEGK